MNAPLSAYQRELEELCSHYGVRRLDVFGSATGQGFDPARSDFDFLVEFKELPPGQRADAYFGLLESLESLLKRPVDLVMTRAIRNPYFRERVEQTRQLIYAA